MIGNDKADALYGNTQANSLDGSDGSDILYGYAGNDTLKGGTGNDYMEGGYGDDTYYVDRQDSDAAIEAARRVPTVTTRLSPASITRCGAVPASRS